MKLSKKVIEEFKKIYLRKEGKKLSDKEAFEIATNLLLAFEAVYRPICQKDKNELKKYELQNKNLESKS